MSKQYTPSRAIVTTELHQVGGRPPFREYLRQLGERRHFIAMQAWSTATHSNRGMWLGNIWMVLGPLLDGLVYFLIFGVLFQAGRQTHNYPGFLIVGILMFMFTSRCLTSSVSSIHAGRNLVQAFTFPRAALPIASVLRETISTLPTLVVVSVLVILISRPVPVSPAWVLIPLLYGMHAVFNLGLGLIVARLGALIPDIRQLVSYGIRVLMYASAVIFAVERFDAIPGLRPIVENSPLYLILHMYRGMFLYGELPTPSQWTAVAAWAGGLALVGLVYFWQGEVRYGRRR